MNKGSEQYIFNTRLDSDKNLCEPVGTFLYPPTRVSCILHVPESASSLVVTFVIALQMAWEPAKRLFW